MTSAGQAPRIAELRISASDEDLQAGRSTSLIDIDSTRGIYIRIHFPQVVPLGTNVTLDLYCPDGALVSSSLFPVDGADVDCVLPLAGTDLAARRLTGTLGLFATLEGTEWGATSFELQAGADD